MVFRDSRLKIDRAKKHIAEAEQRIELITGPDGQTSRIEHHVQARVKAVHYHLTRLGELPEVSCIIGDAIHNLKTALDFAWFQCIKIVLPGNDIRSKFPVYPSVDLLKKSLTDIGIPATDSRLFSLIVRDIKPYDGGNFYIRPLHLMDRMDKHQVLLPSSNYGSVAGLEVKDQYGPVRGGTWGGELPEEFHIDFAENVEITDKGAVTFGIVFKEGPLVNIPIVDALQDASATFLGIVKLMEEAV